MAISDNLELEKKDITPTKETVHDDSDIEDLIEVEITEEEGDRSLLLATNAMSSASRINLLELICAYISLFIMNKPKIASSIVVTFLVAMVLVVNLTLNNAPASTPESIVGHDYTSITSKYDLTVGHIDHWCLQGGDEKCRCEDPLQPSKKEGYRNWQKAHDMNKARIDDAFSDIDDDYYIKDYVDIVFLGENIVEAWAGRSVSFNSTFASDVKEKFDKKFSKKNGGKFNGVPLGIAGDTTSNVLWRIQNGEMPDYLNPAVWWLVLGTNDLAMKQCSEEVVLLGILRVVEEITAARPDAKIVISSILPMTTDKQGRVPIISKKENKKNGKKDEKVDNKKHADERRHLQEELRALKGKDKIPTVQAAKRKGKDKTPTVQVRKSAFAWTRISLWPSVSALNSVLKVFCSKHKHIVFFDAYDIFIDTETDDDIPAVKKEMVKSYALGQPSIEGHEALIKGMGQKMTNYYKKWYGEFFDG